MKFIVTDLKRIFTEPSFYISIVLNLILLFGGMVCVMGNCENDMMYLSSQSLALPFAAPVLAAMPYAVMIMQEKETRYDTLMKIKLRAGGYGIKRFLTCGISGGAALFIPQSVLFIVCLAMNGIREFSYDFTVLLLSFTFGFGYSVISYGLTFVNNQRYVPLVMPQVVYLLCIYSFPLLKLEKFYPPLDISPSVYGGDITIERLAVPLCLTVTGFLLTLLGKAGERR